MKAIEPQLVVVEAGAVMLGLPPCDAQTTPTHRWPSGVRVDVPTFAIARHAVTVSAFEQFTTATGYSRPQWMNETRFSAPNQPAIGLSWNDAANYAQWLARETGKPYRLPRDAEWEKAARGGRDGMRYPWGDESPLGRCCFGRDGDTDHPEPVDAFKPNGLGLYNMVGNVWQWCEDLYIDTAADDDPVNTPTNRPARENRVLRGGSFMTSDVSNLQCAYRHEDPPDLRHPCLGMRLAMDV